MIAKHRNVGPSMPHAQPAYAAVPDRIDFDTDGQVDDLWFANPAAVHLERLGSGSVWGAIYLRDGRRFSFRVEADPANCIYDPRLTFNGDWEYTEPPTLDPTREVRIFP